MMSMCCTCIAGDSGVVAGGGLAEADGEGEGEETVSASSVSSSPTTSCSSA